MDVDWIKEAIDVLKYVGVVREMQVNTETDGKNGGKEVYVYPKAFKGYISSLGAAIVQSGMVPALSIYENDDNGSKASNAENNRAYLIKAVVILLERKGVIPSEVAEPYGDKKCIRLSEYLVYYCPQGQRQHLKSLIHRALVAIKLALRAFRPCEDETVRSGCGTLTASSIRSDNPKSSNIGWLFYRNLYFGFGHVPISEREMDLRMQQICDSRIDDYLPKKESQNADWNENICPGMSFFSEIEKEENAGSFELVTTYPGLLKGSGLSHGIDSTEDSKIGFVFDHTTGLPYIPGSSIKGAIRSVFPDSKKDGDTNAALNSYIKELCDKCGKNINVEELTDTIFGGKDNAGKVVFLDAMISKSRNGDKTFMGRDYITPHPNPLKNPLPIMFLKVKSGIVFSFRFLVKDKGSLDKEFLSELFRTIICDIGLGAKTNVGYGHFEEVFTGDDNQCQNKKNK